MSTTVAWQVQERRRALLIATVAAVVLYVLWNQPIFNSVLYPLRLFVTYIHEAGHSLAAIITGGRVERFIVSANGSGVAWTAGGNRLVISAAGYLGAALFGSGLFYVVNRFPRWDSTIAFFLGIFMVVFTVSFARPDEGGAPVAIIIGLLFGVGLFLLGWRAPRFLTLLVLDVLAISTALNAVLDVWYLVTDIGASRGLVVNDAAAFARQTGWIPASVVALLWSLIAVAMFSLAVWYAVWKPLQAEIKSLLQR
ncbi:MAG: M50 family metallopeptidase [Phototrophicaceae bacterium]